MEYEAAKAIILNASKSKLDEIVYVYNQTASHTMQEREEILSSLERYTFGRFLRNQSPDEVMEAYFEELERIKEELHTLSSVGKLIMARELQLRGDL